MTEGMLFLSAQDVAAAVTPARAAAAIRAALRGHLDPADDVARSAVPVSSGQLLLMPAQSASSVGLKAVTVAPGNASRGLPRIQAVYLLMDAATLTPTAVLDGTALTTLRTPAVSVAAVLDPLRRLSAPVDVTLFGAGPQATGHLRALQAVDGLRLGRVTFVVRHPESVRLPAGEVLAGELLAVGDAAVADALARSQVVVCATSARTPLFAAADVPRAAVVVAVGSHEPQARELPAGLLARSTVIVEDVATALREAGDVVLAIDEGALRASDLLTMRSVVRGEAQPAPDRPVVFTSVGMSWQDLVVAEEVVRQHRLSVG